MDVVEKRASLNSFKEAAYLVFNLASLSLVPTPDHYLEIINNRSAAKSACSRGALILVLRGRGRAHRSRSSFEVSNFSFHVVGSGNHVPMSPGQIFLFLIQVLNLVGNRREVLLMGV